MIVKSNLLHLVFSFPFILSAYQVPAAISPFQHVGYVVSVHQFNEPVAIKEDGNSHNTSINQLAQLPAEIFVGDSELWWQYNPSRSLEVPVAFYLGDNSELFTRYIYAHASVSDHHYHNGNVGTKIMDDKIEKARAKFVNYNIFICGNSMNDDEIDKYQGDETVGHVVPYRFTVLGDSHTGAFDFASLRVRNMNVTTVSRASMYELNNDSLTSRTYSTFKNVIDERRWIIDGHSHRVADGEKRNVLVFNLGEEDVHGVNWRQYLSNETEGMVKSFKAFSHFLKEHVEDKGGYSKVVLVTVAPPTVQNESEAHKQGLRIHHTGTYKERVLATEAFNKAMQLFCAERKYCTILDITPFLQYEVTSENTSKSGSYTKHVFKPYTNLVRADQHLKADRVFGILVEQLRSTLNAEWCSSECEFKNLKNTHGEEIKQPECTNIVGDMSKSFEKIDMKRDGKYPYGFEPVLVDILLTKEDGSTYLFTINAPHYLTPTQIVRKVIEKNDLVESDQGLATLQEIVEESQIVFWNFLLTILNDFLGEKWGSMYH